jgi:hypothetical protein
VRRQTQHGIECASLGADRLPDRLADRQQGMDLPAKAPAFAHESAKIQPSSATTVATSTEGVMNQSVLAYLLGPLVMAVVGVVLWAVAHYHHDDHQGERRERWLDTHPVDWMRHRH